MTSIDWTCPAIVDVIWTTLLSEPWLIRYAEFGYRTVAPLYMTVSSVFAALHVRRRANLARFIDAPFLGADSDLTPHLLRMANVDFSLRILTQDISSRCLARKLPCRVRGDFPTWKLSRMLDVLDGGTGIPRTWHASGRHSYRYKHLSPFWIPRDIDIFIETNDPEDALRIVLAAFRRHVESLWGKKVMTDCTCFPYTDERVAFEGGAPRLLADLARFGLPEHTIEQAFEQYERAHKATGIAATRRMWRILSPMRDVNFPGQVVVWDCRRRTTPMACLRHHDIAIEVCDGRWCYKGPEEAILLLQRRKLVIQTDVNLAASLIQCLEDGFSFEGLYRTFTDRWRNESCITLDED